MATSIDDNAADGNSGKSFIEMSMIQYTKSHENALEAMKMCQIQVEGE